MLPCAGGVFKPIWGKPHIGFFGELDRRSTAVGGMRSAMVAVVHPCGQHGSGVRQRREQRLVQAFVARPTAMAHDWAKLEQLREAITGRARCNASRSGGPETTLGSPSRPSKRVTAARLQSAPKPVSAEPPVSANEEPVRTSRPLTERSVNAVSSSVSPASHFASVSSRAPPPGCQDPRERRPRRSAARQGSPPSPASAPPPSG